MRNRLFTSDQELEICRQYQTGWSTSYLGGKWYCDPRTIFNIVKRNGFQIRVVRYPTELKEMILKTYELYRGHGYSRHKVAEELGVSYEVVSLITSEAMRKRNRRGEDVSNR